MSIIKSPLLFSGTKNDKYLYGLFDSGANLSAIRKGLADKIDLLIPLPKSIKLAIANSSDFMQVDYKFVCNFF